MTQIEITNRRNRLIEAMKKDLARKRTPEEKLDRLIQIGVCNPDGTLTQHQDPNNPENQISIRDFFSGRTT